MKLGLVTATAAVVLAVAGCGSSDANQEPDPASSAAGSASEVAESIAARAGEVFDDAKAQTFVVAFRAQFPALAESRDDNAIKQLLSSTCTEIALGTEQSAVVSELETQAASGGNAPTTEQAQRIYDQATVACA